MSTILLAHSGEDHSAQIEQILSNESVSAPTTQKIEFIDPIQHPDLLNTWFADPVFIIIVLFGFFYLRGFLKFRHIRRVALGYRQAVYFGLCVLSLFIGLCTPIDYLADYSFFFHMVQHVIIIQFAAPFLCLAAPHLLLLKGYEKLPFSGVINRIAGLKAVNRSMRFLISPVVAIFLYNAAFWFWHIPYFYNLALENELAHNLEHAAFFYTAVLFWWSILTPGAAPKFIWPLRMLWIIISMMISGILAALINFANEPLYRFYDQIRPFGFDALTDQRVGALFMWVPGSLLYFITMGIVFFKGYREEIQKTPVYSA